MVFSPLNFFLLWFVVCGTFLTLLSSNWFIAWVGMELNLLAFLPWVLEDKGSGVVQASVQYFIIQGVGSVFFLLAGVLSYSSELFSLSGLVVFSGLLVKAGSVPVHQWLPSIVENLSWCRVFFVLTWQKVGPLLMCANVVGGVSGVGVFFILALLNSYVGAFGGLNQTSLRPLMGYSSISHLGWVIALMLVSSSAATWYLMGYIMLVFPFFFFFLGGGVESVVDVSDCAHIGKFSGMVLVSLVLSMAGLPPFFGFFLKLFALFILVMHSGCIMVGLLLLISSLLGLVYYLSLVLVFFKFSGGYLSSGFLSLSGCGLGGFLGLSLILVGLSLFGCLVGSFFLAF